jgi:hypothetical protein
MVQEVKKDEDWMQKKWRPAMGWMYMIVCMCDMVIFPVLWALLQATMKQPVTQWNPLTLQGAGLFHLAMGAVLGIAAFGRTQEKIAGSATNAPTTPPSATTFPAGMSTTSSVPTLSSFQAQPMASTGGFGSTPPPPATGFGSGLSSDDPPTRNTRND